ncbi:UNE1-like protein [Trifolium pratense]|uniref:UNE1-like protein n=1 Tax=Trifolium pratense TaxID=57577 RepID=A0A2K3N611_TRIPR|nr:UNE1-like protein [Trifolium pratense]
MNNRSKKFAKTFQKVISLKSATKIASNNGICMLNSNLKVKEDSFTDHHTKTNGNNKNKARNKAVMEALIARLFAGVTTIKASYAELQMAQHPYNNDSIQAADQAVVDELRAISELKRRFLKKELNLSPQVTIMLAEIQEQQSIMKTYEITIKKLQGERKLVNSGGNPDSAFFLAFAEMAKRVWTLHYLAFSFQENVNIFQVKKNTRFSEVYMESVTEESVSTTSGSVESTDSNSSEFRVVFTVVPGFKIGKTVIQSQVYLSLMDSPSSS